MIVGDTRKLLLAILLLDVPFPIDIHLRYRENIGDFGGLAGLGLSTTTVCLVALYTLWIFGRPRSRATPGSRSWLAKCIPLGVYLTVVVLSMLVAQDVELAFFELSLLIQMFLLFIYLVGTVRTREDVLFIVTVLLIGLLLESLVILALKAIGHSVRVGPIFARVSGGGARIAGTFGSANGTAGYLSLLLVPAISLTLAPLGRGHKLLAVLAAGLGVTALIFTRSRGGWLAFAISFSLLFILVWRRGWLPTSSLLVIGISAVLLVAVWQQVVLDRLLSDDRGAAASRVPLMNLAFRMIADHPVLGVGANNFTVAMMDYVDAEVSDFLFAVHNKYLLIWSETGIAGILAFIWFLFSTLHHGWQSWKLEDRQLALIALGFTVAMVGHMTHMLADIFNDRPQVESLWIVAGLITTIGIVASATTTTPSSNALLPTSVQGAEAKQTL